jgi:hypothetical protein
MYLLGVLSGYEGRWIMYSSGRLGKLPDLVIHGRRLNKHDAFKPQAVVRNVDCVVVWPKRFRGLALGTVCPHALPPSADPYTEPAEWLDCIRRG